MNQVAERDEAVSQLTDLIGTKDRELHYRQTRIEQLMHEMALLKRYQFGRRSEHMDSAQASLLDESIDADLAAIEEALAQLSTKPALPADASQKPKRAPLPANLPRRVIHHEPESTICGCGCTMKRIGEDVAEKLDYVPGVFTVEQHVRGKWVCGKCETLIQAPVPAHVIDKGIPTAGLLAQVLVAKYADHLPLYRQENIFSHAGLALPRSTLGQWVGVCGVRLQPLVDALRADLLRHGVLHADETPVRIPMIVTDDSGNVTGLP
jgi:transposase